MNVLFTKSLIRGQDYLYDSVFHGMRSLLGDSVIDAPHMWYMYKESFKTQDKSQILIQNKGFTLYGILDDIPVDRTDVVGKIRKKYYDLIVIGNLEYSTPYLEEIFANYQPHQIVILDSRDGSVIHKSFLNKAIYFKREFYYGPSGVYPISFSFPREKLQNKMEKTRLFSIIDPRYRETYIYDTEESYYADYGSSYFGVTMKKAGWDCMRHYEIIACNSVPLFLDIESCPANICTTLPKGLLVDVVQTFRDRKPEWFFTKDGADYYTHMKEQIYGKFINNCLTETSAKSIIDKHMIHKAGLV